jgi:enterochelin esterase-like enzyme
MYSIGSNIRRLAQFLSLQLALPSTRAFFLTLALFGIASASVYGQAGPNSPIISPEVHPDGAVTFRYVSTTAKNVAVSVEGTPTPIPLTAGDAGVWTLTTAPMAPEYYNYRFVVDGERVLDSRNILVRTNLLNAESVVHVTGPTPMPWDLTDIPHGETHHLFYQSKLANESRDLWVYTPPSYDARRKEAYPVLYLLHGYSDGAEGWLEGQANFILDTLLAQGKISPMVVVMPRGYGTMRLLTEPVATRPPGSTLSADNVSMFTDQLLHEILPMMESQYNIAHDRAHRAMAGLSLGGAQTIASALNHPEVFSYVGAFSSALATNDPAIRTGKADDATYNAVFARMVPNAATQAPLKLLWISCGTEDGLITVNRHFEAWAKANVKGNVSTNETPGRHTWLVWRNNLVSFAPLLFR